MKTQNEIYRDRFVRQLDANVAAVNQANAEANRLRPLFIEAFRPYAGKKILIHGGLAQKPKEMVDALVPFVADGYRTPSVYRNSSAYSLSFTVKTCVSAKGEHGSCSYHETTFYVGTLDGYNLARVEELDAPGFKPYRTDYTAEEVHGLRKALDDAEKAMRAAQSALSPFGRYDQ